MKIIIIQIINNLYIFYFLQMKKKAIIEDLIRVFAGTNILLEKINILLFFFKKYLQEGNAISQL